jgi:hypothetical protein
VQLQSDGQQRQKCGLAKIKEIFCKSRGGSRTSTHNSNIFRGFRPVDPALVVFLYTVNYSFISALNINQYSLSKAFDWVNHYNLLRKLHFYHIQVTAA